MSLINQALLSDLVNSTPWLRNDKELSSLLQDAYSENSRSWRAVNRLVDDLLLEPYKLERLVVQEPNPEILPALTFDQPQMRAPEISDNQRRFSMDLMQQPSTTTAIRKTSLSKPAETAITNVNIVTKVTELEGREYKPLYKEKPMKLKKKLHGIFPFKDRWDSLRNDMRPSREESLPRAENTENLEINRNKANNERTKNQSAAPPVPESVKADRRRSLVTQYLPTYIRDQLRDLSTNTSSNASVKHHPEVTESATTTTLHLRVTSYKSSADAGIKPDENRINNLLANSLSFYYKNDDEISAGNTFDDSSVSDADKEYILPGSFTRSADDYDHNTAYTHIDEETEDSEIEEEDEDEDNEDEYLFR